MNNIRPPAAVADGDARTGDRRQQIIDIAARLFAQKGYRGTSMRDIGEHAGLLGGSLYHHIKSKDALFIEIHNAAMDEAENSIREAIDACSDPWEKLEAACIRLLEIQLAPDSLTTPMMNDFRQVPELLRLRLLPRRDRFEDMFRALIAELPLPSFIDQSVYRNLLLSQINSATLWYRPGRLSPAAIASQIAAVFRHQ